MKTTCGFLNAALLIFSSLFCCAVAHGASTSPCADDIARFCPNVIPGGGAIIECLEKHESELTDACRTHEINMYNRRGERKDMIMKRVTLRKTCGQDIIKFCADVQPGANRIVGCLSEHEKELSAPCRDSVKSMRSAKE
ncbi:MAG TPA: cysteine rich repeat-containing protein [Dissulfurispiraceae bacterium]|nr:cysteine rich repeat-containing protein [Dissulfurispiraceae bacterium]